MQLRVDGHGDGSGHGARRPRARSGMAAPALPKFIEPVDSNVRDAKRGAVCGKVQADRIGGHQMISDRTASPSLTKSSIDPASIRMLTVTTPAEASQVMSRFWRHAARAGASGPLHRALEARDRRAIRIRPGCDIRRRPEPTAMRRRASLPRPGVEISPRPRSSAMPASSASRCRPARSHSSEAARPRERSGR